MTTAAALDTLGSAKYLSLTTFRKDGSAVATPVWLVRDGDRLLVITDPDSGKAKRLRNNPAVLLSPCDMRGRVKPDAISVPGMAELQDDPQTRRTMDLVSSRYGWMGRILTRRNERKARKAGRTSLAHVGLAITITPAA